MAANIVVIATTVAATVAAAAASAARRAKLSIRFKSKGTLNFVIAFALKFYLSFSWRKLGIFLCCYFDCSLLLP